MVLDCFLSLAARFTPILLSEREIRFFNNFAVDRRVSLQQLWINTFSTPNVFKDCVDFYVVILVRSKSRSAADCAVPSNDEVSLYSRADCR